MKRVRLLYTFFSCVILNQTSAQLKGRPDPSDYGEPYDWSEFNASDFLMSAIICGIIFAAAIKLKSQKHKTYNTIGNVLIGIGVVFALGTIIGPIGAALLIVWQVFVGVAIVGGLIWYALNITNND